MEIHPNEPVNKVNLRHHIDEGWGELQALIARLSVEQLTVPTDAAGWTAKDHLIHLSAWEVGLNALLNRQPTLQAMGVRMHAWSDAPIDEVNADLQQRHRAMPLNEVLDALRRSHEQVLLSISTLTDADLMRPAGKFGPDSDAAELLFVPIVADTFNHYAEHIPWIEAIVERRN